jgi:hypothetical protein
MPVTLSVYERLLLLNVLPREADITQLRIVRDLQETLGFPEAEAQALGFMHEGTVVHWNREAAQDKTIEIGPVGWALIAERLRELSEQKKLTLEHLGLYERFCEQRPHLAVAT